MKNQKPKRNDQAAAPLSFTTEEAREILNEAKAYCKAAGIKHPSKDDLFSAIQYEHGTAFAVAACAHIIYLSLGIRRFHESVYRIRGAQ